MIADDDLKLKQMQELLKGYITRRKVDARRARLQAAGEGGGQHAAPGRAACKPGHRADARQADRARRSRTASSRCRPSIQGDELRVTGKKRDDLQAAIQLVRELKIEQPLQYVNFRD